MWGRSKASEGAGRWESAGGGGFLVRGLIKRAEGEEGGTGGNTKKGGERFFIFACKAYLMISHRQTDRKTQRGDRRTHLSV